MESWKANTLSKAGRAVLIQANLESLPTHTMQCFQLPKKTTTVLDRVNRNFFWKKSNKDQGLPMIAWDTICRPKSFGGLGLRKTEAVNLAFQAKLAWKILLITTDCGQRSLNRNTYDPPRSWIVNIKEWTLEFGETFYAVDHSSHRE